MDQRVEFEEYEDPVTHQRYKIKKITQYIKEEVCENEFNSNPNWDSVIDADEYISVDQLPAAMQRVQASQLQGPPPLVTISNPPMMQMPNYPMQNMGYPVQSRNMNYPEQFYTPPNQYPQTVVQQNSGYQGYSAPPGNYQQYQAPAVHRNEYLAPTNPQGGGATSPHSVMTIANQQQMGQPYTQPPVMYQQQQMGPRMMQQQVQSIKVYKQAPAQRQPLPQQVIHTQMGIRGPTPQNNAQQGYTNLYYAIQPQPHAGLQSQQQQQLQQPQQRFILQSQPRATLQPQQRVTIQPQQHVTVQPRMPLGQTYQMQHWPQQQPGQPMPAPMHQLVTSQMMHPGMPTSVLLAKPLEHHPPQASTSYAPDNLSADPNTRIPKINLLQPKLTNESDVSQKRKRINRKRVSSSDDDNWQPNPTKRGCRTPSTSSTVSSSAEEVLSHVSETASEQSWSSSASIPVQVAPIKRRARFTANKQNWAHMVTPCSVRLRRLTRKHIAVLKASLKEAYPRTQSEQLFSDTDGPPELTSNSSGSPCTINRTPVQPLPAPTPSAFPTNPSIRVVNEPVIETADNFARPPTRQNDELKNESCEVDSYQLENRTLTLVMVAKPTGPTGGAVQSVDLTSKPTKQQKRRGRKLKEKKPAVQTTSETATETNALKGIEKIRSSSHNAERFQNLNNVLVARKRSQNKRASLTEKRPSSGSSAASVSSEEHQRQQPSPDQSTNSKNKLLSKNDDWWPKTNPTTKSCTVSLERIDDEAQPTKAVADSTTDSPVPSTSPALTVRQPVISADILAMRQRLHSKKQIALLTDVHNIRLIRERLASLATPAPAKDVAEELQDEVPVVPEVPNSVAGHSLTNSEWPDPDGAAEIVDIVDSSKLSDASEDFDGLLQMMDKDEDTILNISIDERQIEQIESELGEESLIMILNESDKEEKEQVIDGEVSTALIEKADQVDEPVAKSKTEIEEAIENIPNDQIDEETTIAGIRYTVTHIAGYTVKSETDTEESEVMDTLTVEEESQEAIGGTAKETLTQAEVKNADVMNRNEQFEHTSDTTIANEIKETTLETISEIANEKEANKVCLNEAMGEKVEKDELETEIRVEQTHTENAQSQCEEITIMTEDEHSATKSKSFEISNETNTRAMTSSQPGVRSVETMQQTEAKKCTSNEALEEKAEEDKMETEIQVEPTQTEINESQCEEMTIKEVNDERYVAKGFKICNETKTNEISQVLEAEMTVRDEQTENKESQGTELMLADVIAEVVKEIDLDETSKNEMNTISKSKHSENTEEQGKAGAEKVKADNDTSTVTDNVIDESTGKTADGDLDINEDSERCTDEAINQKESKILDEDKNIAIESSVAELSYSENAQSKETPKDRISETEEIKVSDDEDEKPEEAPKQTINETENPEDSRANRSRDDQESQVVATKETAEESGNKNETPVENQETVYSDAVQVNRGSNEQSVGEIGISGEKELESGPSSSSSSNVDGNNGDEELLTTDSDDSELNLNGQKDEMKNQKEKCVIS